MAPPRSSRSTSTAIPTATWPSPTPGDGKLTVLLNNGTGDFAAAASSPESVGERASQGGRCSTGRGREHRHLAVANEITDNVTILLGDGTGERAPSPRLHPRAVGKAPWWRSPPPTLGRRRAASISRPQTSSPAPVGNSVSILLNDFASAPPVNPPTNPPVNPTDESARPRRRRPPTKCKKKKKKKKRAGAAAKCQKEEEEEEVAAASA